MKLLQVDSSSRASSVTRRLTAKFREEWKKSHPDGEVIQRDLSATALPLITDDWLATRLEESKLTPAQRSYLSTSDELIEELQAADTVVIGAPMYNFSIPSSLKAWIDQIVRLGKTVGYGPNGPQGLLARKKVVVITSRGLPMKRLCAGCFRVSGTVPAPHSGFHRTYGRYVYSCREPSSRAGRCLLRRRCRTHRRNRH